MEALTKRLFASEKKGQTRLKSKLCERPIQLEGTHFKFSSAPKFSAVKSNPNICSLGDNP